MRVNVQLCVGRVKFLWRASVSVSNSLSNSFA